MLLPVSSIPEVTLKGMLQVAFKPIWREGWTQLLPPQAVLIRWCSEGVAAGTPVDASSDAGVRRWFPTWSMNPRSRNSIRSSSSRSSREDALARFEAALFSRAILSEACKLADARLARRSPRDVTAPIDDSALPTVQWSMASPCARRISPAAGEGAPVRPRVERRDRPLRHRARAGKSRAEPQRRSPPAIRCRAAPTPSSVVERAQPARIRCDRCPPCRISGAIRPSYAGSDIARGGGTTARRHRSLGRLREIGMLAAWQASPE